jgi:sugar phosphate isomerase/epimerase
MRNGQGTRREFLGGCAMAAGALALRPATVRAAAPQVHFGLVTYMWGAEWDLPTIIKNCQAAGALGVELRTQHKHGVEPSIGPTRRAEVKKMFADNPVTLLGIGCNEKFDASEPEKLAASIEAAKAFIQLSHDVGGSGTKVKPNDFHADVPHEKTIEQVGRSLNTLGKFAADLGQQVRLEVHGQFATWPACKQVMDVADHPSVAVCWNSNPQDLQGEGLEANFTTVKSRLGQTCHVHELDDPKYPYAQLMKLLVGGGYSGWTLMEASSKPADNVKALTEQREIWQRLIAEAGKA